MEGIQKFTLETTKSCDLYFSEKAGTILRIVWNRQLVVSTYLSKEIHLVSESGDIKRRSISDSVARIARYKELLVFAFGYDNQKLVFMDENVVQIHSLILNLFSLEGFLKSLVPRKPIVFT